MQRSAICLGAALLAVCAPCPAERISAQFSVTATVVPACTGVTASNLDFGTYVAGGNAADAQSVISVTCSGGTSYTVALDSGVAGAGDSQRNMTGASSALRYSLFQNPERSAVWGSTASSGKSAAATGAPQAFPVYGRIFPGQVTPAGQYADVITVTVTF